MTNQREIEIIDVGPRDGLQNESKILSIDTKVAFIRKLVDAGIKRMEAVSFVNPKRVPQMAEAEEVLGALPEDDGVTYIGLVLNRRGLDRALAAGCKEVNYALVASDTFSQKNQGTTIEQAVAVYEDIAAESKIAGVRCSLTISTAFGCPFQGEVPPERVIDLVERVAGDETYEIALADTIGCAVPSQVTELFSAVMDISPGARFRAHFHNTRNTGLANCYAAVEAGVQSIDSSAGGIGGCPFAPRATGNVPSEDLVYMLDRMGVETGIDINKLIAVGDWIGEQLGHVIPAMIGKAGLFPPEASRP
ncbi:MAG: (R)-citramalyl-CoA lyase [Alphaproteobacteria bacterium MarineAlpha11_Bin1]|nr:MAG: (R)-citramalyl-CoA lyase [Alphaproteobacteria bacterium MarineAlpha11_Bin1]|tara:strand:- start:17742 stop:18659 length:918 start_codon:yes stop_codon:yes gene_type:complete